MWFVFAVADWSRVCLLYLFATLLPSAMGGGSTAAHGPPLIAAVASGTSAIATGGIMLPGRRVSHVLIISEDGLRPDLVERMYLPWHERLLQHGSYTMHAQTIRDASTLPAHASMLSGVTPKMHGLTWNGWHPDRGYIKTETIFSRAQEAGLKTAFFTGKPKLWHIVPPGSADISERPGYYCKKVAQEAANYLVKHRPELAFAHFSDPDEFGHSKGWLSPEQLKAVSQSDRCIGVLVRALERADMLKDTLIIVSADHGGHGHVHSGVLKIDREIPWIAMGPGVREHYTIRTPLSTMDTAATVFYALGLPMPPGVVGKPRTEIFEK